MRQKLVIGCFVAILAVFLAANLIYDAPEILMSERRVAERLPVLSVETVFSGAFMEGFEGYAADRFPLREGFRAVRAGVTLGVFAQTDIDGLFRDGDGVSRFSAVNADSVRLAAEKMAAVAAELEGLRIFYAVIPDKSAFSSRAVPGFDAGWAAAVLDAYLPAAFTYIPLAHALDAYSFYRTDPHWNQIAIGDAAVALADAMGITLDFRQFVAMVAGHFLGAYGGQLAWPVAHEPMYFLENPHLSAYYLNVGARVFEAGPVYDLARFGGWDPFDIFLRGAQPVVVVTNAHATSDRVLYLFRDSFSSPLAPILASGYARVYLIDFRFIDLRTVREVIDFQPDADALFLFSSGILNHAEVLLT